MKLLFWLVRLKKQIFHRISETGRLFKRTEILEHIFFIFIQNHKMNNLNSIRIHYVALGDSSSYDTSVEVDLHGDHFRSVFPMLLDEGNQANMQYVVKSITCSAVRST